MAGAGGGGVAGAGVAGVAGGGGSGAGGPGVPGPGTSGPGLRLARWRPGPASWPGGPKMIKNAKKCQKT